MDKDPIVEEIRKHREAHAKKFDYDLRAIFADLKRQEDEDTRPHADLMIKRRRVCSVAEKRAPYGRNMPEDGHNRSRTKKAR